MPGATATAMDGLEIAEFLTGQRTGVLSMAAGDAGYAIPVSFVYDDAEPAVYLRLGFTPGSQKRRFLDAADRVSLVVYDETDEGWKSVVVEGGFEELAATSLDAAIVESVRGLDIPYFSVHRRPAGDLEFRILRIDIGSVSGIVEGRSPRGPTR